MQSELQRGEHKCLQTDWVILMPGPEDYAVVTLAGAENEAP